MKIHKILFREVALALLLCITGNTFAQVKNLEGKTISAREIDAFIQHQMDSLKIPALSIAIVQKGEVVYYKASGVKNAKKQPIDTATVFEAASMTKPVFAYAVHKLVRDHVIGLDTPLCRYYPYDDIDHDERYKRITARMVLSHTTGFPNWRACGSCELSILFEPGTQYGYSGEGFEYLALVVKHQLHKTITDLVEEQVFAPLSIHHAYLVKNQYVREHLAEGLKDNKEWGQNGTWLRPQVAYGLSTEARGYARFVIGLMKESQSSNSIFRQMAEPQMQIEPGKWACLGVFMEQTAYGPKYSHSGNNNNRYNSNFEFYKDHDLGYVFFMNCHKEPEFTKKLNKFLTNK